MSSLSDDALLQALATSPWERLQAAGADAPLWRIDQPWWRRAVSWTRDRVELYAVARGLVSSRLRY